MSERNLETGLEYADVDLFGLRMRAGRGHVPSWRGAWVWCLQHFDYEAAELIVSRNLVSDECEAEAHDDCYFRWCNCSHHSAAQFKAEHPQLKSLSECESENESVEAA